MPRRIKEPRHPLSRFDEHGRWAEGARCTLPAQTAACDGGER